MPAIVPYAKSKLPHCVAWVLACVSFPLIFVGGLVTSFNAGMAVPDWPSTYGYNLLLYPWETWFFGPWDIFIEHGHRLLGAAAGFFSIALVVSAFYGDGRKWFRWLSVLALVLVVIQGSLGGARVLLDERLLARLHGCLGPAFFALTAAIVTVTSTRWREARSTEGPESDRPLCRAAVFVVCLSYLQIILGSLLRHIATSTTPGLFRAALLLHLITALLLVVQFSVIAWRACRGTIQSWWVRRPAFLLVGLVVAQVSLGGASWCLKYGWPSWLKERGYGVDYTVVAESFVQAVTVTSHVAVGSLILAVSTSLALRAARIGWGLSSPATGRRTSDGQDLMPRIPQDRAIRECVAAAHPQMLCVFAPSIETPSSVSHAG